MNRHVGLEWVTIQNKKLEANTEKNCGRSMKMERTGGET